MTDAPMQSVAIPAEAFELIYSDTPLGFRVFYLLVTGNGLPEHAYAWIEHLYAAHAQGKPSVIEAFRGSTKTTTLTQLFVAYRIGLDPLKTHLIVQAGDDSANENTSKIADIIRNNPGWRVCFPWVVPDESQGWGAKGYEVKDTRADYGEFRRQRTKEPTLLGLGYKSNEAIGKHPSGTLVVDDIITEEVASSELEMRRAVRTFSGTILPTRSPNNPWFFVVGTPWNSSDVIARAKQTGEFACVRTPIYEVAQPGRGVDYMPRSGQFVKLTWPGMWPVDKIERERKLDLTGGPEFDRMYLLVLGSGLKRQLSYQPYPAYVINPGWPTAGGCDPAGVADPSKRDSSHSHFALAYVSKLPTGGAVVTGGVLEQCSLTEGLEYIQAAQGMYPDWLGCTVEGDGIGEGFLQMLMLRPGLRIIPDKTKNTHKADRIVKGVGAWTRIGRVKISDSNTPFLNTLRRFADDYPNVSLSDSGWDAWDSVYWALKQLPDVLAMPSFDENLEPRRKHRADNPFNSLGSQTYN